MSSVRGRWIPWLDPFAGTVTLPLWTAGIVTAAAGAVLTWFLLDVATKQNVAAERRALEARVEMLSARATMPGSRLACLDAMAGENVETACEQMLFATPEGMASAASYVATQIDLFADVSDFVKRGNSEMARTLATLRHGVETDPYGLVAHVLATRDGCSPTWCPALVTLRNAKRVRTNLAQRTYDSYVIRYSAKWTAPAATSTAGGVAEVDIHPPAEHLSPSTTRPTQSAGRELFFPSSDSIPAVNIMTAEPNSSSETTGSSRSSSRKPAQGLPKRKEDATGLNAAAR
jgi:hypothetical protein